MDSMLHTYSFAAMVRQNKVTTTHYKANKYAKANVLSRKFDDKLNSTYFIFEKKKQLKFKRKSLSCRYTEKKMEESKTNHKTILQRCIVHCMNQLFSVVSSICNYSTIFHLYNSVEMRKRGQRRDKN